MPRKQVNLIDRETVFANIIYELITGSTAYGTSIKGISDTDKKAIAILPITELVKLGQVWETSTYHNPDYEVHSLHKTFKLLKECNPTLLEMFCTDEKFVLTNTEYSKLIRKYVEIFFHKKGLFTFGGFGLQHLYKTKKLITGGLSKDEELIWLNNSLNNMIYTFNERYGNYNMSIDKENGELYVHINGKVPLNNLIGMLSEMENCKKTFENRIETEDFIRENTKENIGKIMSHLIRILREGVEFGETGVVNVFRKDADYLIRIRKNEIPYQDVLAEAKELSDRIESLKKTTKLPDMPDDKKINEIFNAILFSYNHDRGYIPASSNLLKL